MSRNTKERRAAILEILEREGFTSVPQLTRELGYSQATIRRDLVQLGQSGRLRRTYGGALSSGNGETPYHEKLGEAADAKTRIARAAAALVVEGMAVGFTGGTTTLYVARALPPFRDLTVVTNALTIALELSASDIRVIVTGGESRGTTFELVGPLAEPVLQHIHLDLVFVGVDGISLDGGLTTHHPIEAQTNRALIRRAARTVVVADSRKMGRRTFAQIQPADPSQIVITDTRVAEVDRLSAAGIEVIVAG
jgi:DeoR family transcriptional regulator of aga operon